MITIKYSKNNDKIIKTVIIRRRRIITRTMITVSQIKTCKIEIELIK